MYVQSLPNHTHSDDGCTCIPQRLSNSLLHGQIWLCSTWWYLPNWEKYVGNMAPDSLQCLVKQTQRSRQKDKENQPEKEFEIPEQWTNLITLRSECHLEITSQLHSITLQKNQTGCYWRAFCHRSTCTSMFTQIQAPCFTTTQLHHSTTPTGFHSTPVHPSCSTTPTGYNSTPAQPSCSTTPTVYNSTPDLVHIWHEEELNNQSQYLVNGI